jgi:hypothetical protein
MVRLGIYYVLLLIEGMEGFRGTLLEGILKSLSEEIIHI